MHGIAPLLAAIWEGHTATVKLLLAKVRVRVCETCYNCWRAWVYIVVGCCVHIQIEIIIDKDYYVRV